MVVWRSIFPALLLGACGALIFNIPFIGIANDIGPILAVSGMAAVSSSVIGGPITAIILVLNLQVPMNTL